jgi:hypothetical protein
MQKELSSLRSQLECWNDGTMGSDEDFDDKTDFFP